MKSKCDNCGWMGLDYDVGATLESIPHLGHRLEPGGIVPSGECPKCGSLCYPLDPIEEFGRKAEREAIQRQVLLYAAENICGQGCSNPDCGSDYCQAKRDTYFMLKAVANTPGYDISKNKNSDSKREVSGPTHPKG